MSKATHFLYCLVIGAVGVAIFNAKGYEYLGVAVVTVASVLLVAWIWRVMMEDL